MRIKINQQKISINNRFDLVEWLKRLPEQDANNVMQQLLSEPKEFQLLFENIYQFISCINSLPRKYSDQLIQHMLTSGQEFQRLIGNIYAFTLAIKDMSNKYAQAMMQRVLANTEEFQRLINNNAAFIHSVKTPSNPYSKQLIEYVLTHPHEFQRLINDLDSIRKAVQTFPDSSAKEVIRLVHSNYDSGILLHLVQENNARLIPVLLQLGPIRRNQINQTCRFLMGKYNFDASDIDSILSLIQHGADIRFTNFRRKNILTLIYENYPSIKNYMKSFNISDDKLEIPSYIFNRIDIACLRLEIQYQSSMHQARNQFLNLVIWLSHHRSAQSPSFFNGLPLDLVLYIISFLDFAAMETTWQEGTALAKAAFSQPEKIKEMLHAPGGISAYQQTFFKSAKILCRDFDQLKKKLKETQTHRYPRWDKMIGKELTNTSLETLAQFRNTHAISYWSYTQPIPRMELQETIEGSALYQEKKTLKN